MHFVIEENGWVLISTPDQWLPEWLDPNHQNGIKWANERQYRADLGIGYCQRCFKDKGKSKYFKRYKKTHARSCRESREYRSQHEVLSANKTNISNLLPITTDIIILPTNSNRAKQHPGNIFLRQWLDWYYFEYWNDHSTLFIKQECVKKILHEHLSPRGMFRRGGLTSYAAHKKMSPTSDFFFVWYRLTESEASQYISSKFKSMRANREVGARLLVNSKPRHKQIMLACIAKNRAQYFLRNFTKVEDRIIVSALFNNNTDTEAVFAKINMATFITREGMKKLGPGGWLHDEIINFFFNLLGMRDGAICRAHPTRQRSFFMTTFFIRLDQAYLYKPTYSKNAPGGDLFQLRTIFVPVHVSNQHWILVVLHMNQKRIEIYDSMTAHLKDTIRCRIRKRLLQYLNDEHKRLHNRSMPDQHLWRLDHSGRDVPQQKNGFDCGVFVCVFADFLSLGLPLIFEQRHVSKIRGHIILAIHRRPNAINNDPEIVDVPTNVNNPFR